MPALRVGTLTISVTPVRHEQRTAVYLKDLELLEDRALARLTGA